MNDMHTLERYNLIARLQKGNGPYGSATQKSKLGFVALGVLMGVLIVPLAKSCETEQTPQKECAACHNREMAMTDYFRSRNNPHPEAMALAVLKTKNPRLLAAIAVAGEKNTPYTVRRGGYKKEHAGAWQMNQRLHGKQPYTPAEQALNAEAYLVELTTDKPIKTALAIYGGDSTDKYSQRVLAELIAVP